MAACGCCFGGLAGLGGPFFGAGLCAGRVGVALEGAAGSAGRTESASG
jgi:hypothetical protein